MTAGYGDKYDQRYKAPQGYQACQVIWKYRLYHGVYRKAVSGIFYKNRALRYLMNDTNQDAPHLV